MRTYLAIRLCSYPIGYMNGKTTDPPTALAVETTPNLAPSESFQPSEGFCRFVGSELMFLLYKNPGSPAQPPGNRSRWSNGKTCRKQPTKRKTEV